MENNVSEPVKKELFHITTLRELGSNLPVKPVDSSGQLLKNCSFSFNEWDMETEEHLSDLQRKSKNVGEFVNKMLGVLLADFCGVDFQSLKPEEKLLKVSQLEFSNVMYMYMYLRYDELGSELKFDITCPTCKRNIENFVADLGDLEVHTKDHETEYDIKYELRRPIVLNDVGTITHIVFGQSKWEALERQTKDSVANEGKMKRTMFHSAIKSVEGANGPFEKFIDLQTVLSKLKKVDIELAMKAVVENNAGPHMVVKGQCPHCESEWFRQLDWGYESFFDSSSL